LPIGFTGLQLMFYVSQLSQQCHRKLAEGSSVSPFNKKVEIIEKFPVLY